MAKRDNSLTKEQIDSYDYFAIKKNLDSIFTKYSIYSERIKELRLKMESARGSVMEETGIKYKSNDGDKMLRMQCLLESLEEKRQPVKDVIDANIDDLCDVERLIFEKVLCSKHTNEELMEILNKKSEYVNKYRKSCYIKVSKWFLCDVYK